jgi:hypothetical protein
MPVCYLLSAVCCLLCNCQIVCYLRVCLLSSCLLPPAPETPEVVYGAPHIVSPLRKHCVIECLSTVCCLLYCLLSAACYLLVCLLSFCLLPPAPETPEVVYGAPHIVSSLYVSTVCLNACLLSVVCCLLSPVQLPNCLLSARVSAVFLSAAPGPRDTRSGLWGTTHCLQPLRKHCVLECMSAVCSPLSTVCCLLSPCLSALCLCVCCLMSAAPCP